MRLHRAFAGSRLALVARTDGGDEIGIAHSWEEVMSGRFSPGGEPQPESGPQLPPAEPTKVVCIGLNYRQHALEMGKPLPDEPLFFLKPSTSVIGSGEAIRLPAASSDVHFEGELAIVIGRTASRVRAEDAASYIAGYTIMNDVTARDIQRREKQYTHAKGFDTFAPLGPCIVSGLDPKALTVETRVNGVVRQKSGCDDMIFEIPMLLACVSAVMTLLPGDVLSTGTPSGVGPMVAGDTVSVSIEGIGVLTNPVVRSA